MALFSGTGPQLAEKWLNLSVQTLTVNPLLSAYCLSEADRVERMNLNVVELSSSYTDYLNKLD